MGVCKGKNFSLFILAVIFPLLTAFDYMEFEDEYKYLEETRFYQAASVLVMDANTGVVLYEKEGYTRRYPASITKVMTALLVLENVTNLEEHIVFSEHAIDIPVYASRMNMEVGESITVLEALYGIMLPSGNEVARALAEHVSGSVAAFVDLMNARAWQLGAYQTNFVNPCGLPGDGQFVTAYDVALIMKEAIKHPVFIDLLVAPYFELAPTAFYDYPRQIVNTNRMVRPTAPEFNPYVIGGKTGFTNAAGHTLVTYAKKDEHELIITVLYAPRGATFTDTAALMDYVFEMLQQEDEPEEIEKPEEIYIPEPSPIVIEIAEEPKQYEEPEQYEELEQLNDLTNRDALVSALMSLTMVIVALGAIWWISKKKYPDGR